MVEMTYTYEQMKRYATYLRETGDIKTDRDNLRKFYTEIKQKLDAKQIAPPDFMKEEMIVLGIWKD